jgi:hypothetical protein
MATDEKWISLLLKELKNDDPEIQDAAIRKIEEAGGREAIIALAKYLDHNQWRQAKGFDVNWRGPKGERLEGRNVYEPLSHLAAKALARLIPNPPVSPGETLITTEHVEEWKTWWKENKMQYIVEEDKSS